MSVTAQQVFDTAMDMIDERLETGVIDPDNTEVYSKRTPGLLTSLQNELARVGKLFATFEVSNYPLDNELSDNFNIIEFKGTDLTYECNTSIQAYYFEVDRPCTVYVEDYTSSWNTLATETITGISEYTAYKGIVTPTAGASKSRLRFSGSYYYRHVNRALFNVPFSLASDIPDYEPWVSYTMPTAFDHIKEVILEDNRQYNLGGNYKFEGKTTLKVNYFYKGKVRVIYVPVPTVITALTDTIQIDDTLSYTGLATGLAQILIAEENQALSNFFGQKFDEFKAFATIEQPNGAENILDLYGGFNG